MAYNRLTEDRHVLIVHSLIRLHNATFPPCVDLQVICVPRIHISYVNPVISWGTGPFGLTRFPFANTFLIQFIVKYP